MRHVLALTLLCLTVLLAPHSTSAASPWSEPFALGSGGTKPSVAVSADGTQHFAWWNPNTLHIEYTSCSATEVGSCAATQALPDLGPSYYPSIALDPQNRPNVVFETKYGSSYQVFWTRLENGTWSVPVQVSHEPYSELPDVAIGPGGILHVAYQSKQGNTGAVYYAESDGSAWNTAEALERVTATETLSVQAEVANNRLSESANAQLATGFYPRVAADENDRAYVVWSAPSPYGIYYRLQKAKGWSKKIRVASGQKDQAPDVTVGREGSVGIVWGTYDDFNAAFAEYHKGKRENYSNDIDGGLAQSLGPRIATDCAGRFHFVFQGRPTASGNWNIYYRTYDPVTDKTTRRNTIAALDAQEQTPAVATSEGGIAVAWANTSYQILNASTSGFDCP